MHDAQRVNAHQIEVQRRQERPRRGAADGGPPPPREFSRGWRGERSASDLRAAVVEHADHHALAQLGHQL